MHTYYKSMTIIMRADLKKIFDQFLCIMNELFTEDTKSSLFIMKCFHLFLSENMHGHWTH